MVGFLGWAQSGRFPSEGFPSSRAGWVWGREGKVKTWGPMWVCRGLVCPAFSFMLCVGKDGGGSGGGSAALVHLCTNKANVLEICCAPGMVRGGLHALPLNPQTSPTREILLVFPFPGKHLGLER